ncbi:MAG: hypothetical protein OK422_00030 [Thaumarchaeota archaeon]|nr:hypothetical protein [Nitrososphaerota archaeon]
MPLTRVQDPELENVPELALAKLTVPVGLIVVPESVSATVAMHVLGALTTIGLGVQFTDEEVVLVPVDTEADALLAAWSVSPPQLPLIVMLPVLPVLGVKVREQPTLAPPPLKVQVPDEENIPGLLEVKLTDPDGVIAVPLFASETVAAHVVALFTWTEPGTHKIDTVVERCPTPTGIDCAPELTEVEWAASPAYDAPIVCEPSLPGFGV